MQILNKILIVIGAIAVFLLVAFSIFKFVPATISSIANVSSSVSTKVQNTIGHPITISANTTSLLNGDDFTLAWKNSLEKEGKYFISYDCIENFYLNIKTTAGSQKLLCNTTNLLGEKTGSIELTAILSKDNSFVDVPIHISFIENGKDKESDKNSISITVRNTNGTGTLSNATITTQANGSDTSSNTSNNSYTQNPSYTGAADLTISNPVTLQGQSAVQFTVTNIGGQASGIWNFSYTTPTYQSQTLTSPEQYSISPGQSMLITVSFERQDTASATTLITIDPSYRLSESNRSNNTRTITVTNSSIYTNSASNAANNYTYNNYTNYQIPSIQYGSADSDLIIRNLEVGYLSGSRFREDDSLDERDDLAVRFTVKNNGDGPSGSWYFDIDDLPYDRSSKTNYKSLAQRSLQPGDSTEIILEFENIDSGTYDIEVSVETLGDEDNTRNNSDEVRLKVRS